MTATAANPAEPAEPIELLSPELTADPFAGYARMREQAPVLTGSVLGGPPVWMVTRYDDVRRVLTEPCFLTNPASVPGAEVEDGPAILKQLNIPDDVVDLIALAMMNLDGAPHARLRKLVSRAFTARRVAELRPQIEHITAGLLDGMAEAGRDGTPVDLVSAFCYPVPIAVICELVGIDEADRPQWHGWGRVLSLMQVEHLPRILRECADHVQEVIARRRAEPRDDLISALIQAQEEDGDRLSDREMVRLVFTMVTAGHESTTYLLGNSVLALLEHPEQLALLRAEPSRWPQAVRELMRLGPSQFAQARYTAEEVELGGVTIPAGEPVVPLLLAANTDPRKYDDPERLDVCRSAGNHLGFGMGSHYCLGAPLAYQEAEVALEALFTRFPDLSLAVGREELPWALRPGFTRVAELPLRLA
ncbi:cytochrome P450 [Actinokineospora sp. PR83]|uniref:cytochrome P450 family protein n=1 Tax=Actinokineospora sp. PR83 TaxID=2884908 RepID=UPI001F1D710B|nr:cytochrome P450 [Actinokineospora sp. PR83]MCG8915911.1 cytochrome P450 [Actinokineospora sp. PR83]